VRNHYCLLVADVKRKARSHALFTAPEVLQPQEKFCLQKSFERSARSGPNKRYKTQKFKSRIPKSGDRGLVSVQFDWLHRLVVSPGKQRSATCAVELRKTERTTQKVLTPKVVSRSTTLEMSIKSLSHYRYDGFPLSFNITNSEFAIKAYQFAYGLSAPFSSQSLEGKEAAFNLFPSIVNFPVTFTGSKEPRSAIKAANPHTDYPRLWLARRKDGVPCDGYSHRENCTVMSTSSAFNKTEDLETAIKARQSVDCLRLCLAGLSRRRCTAYLNTVKA
jgi:hypothetical protein